MLSDRRIRTLKPAHCDKWYSDGNGLYLRVRATGGRSWVLRRKRGGHLLALINDILDISRIDAGDCRLDESTVDLRELIPQIVAAIPEKMNPGTATLVSEVEQRRRVVPGDRLASQARAPGP